MARREWAEQQVDKVSVFRFLDRDDNSLCVPDAEAVKLLRKEHVRAVRIVQKIKRRHSNAQEDAIYSHGFTKACEDILKALKEGRA